MVQECVLGGFKERESQECVWKGSKKMSVWFAEES